MPPFLISFPSTVSEIFPKGIPPETALTNAIRNFPDNDDCKKAARDYSRLAGGNILQNPSISNLSIDFDVMQEAVKKVPGATYTAIAVVALLNEYGGNLEDVKEHLPKRNNLIFNQINTYNDFFEYISTGRQKYLDSQEDKNQFDALKEIEPGEWKLGKDILLCRKNIRALEKADEPRLQSIQKEMDENAPQIQDGKDFILFEHNNSNSNLVCFPENEPAVRNLLAEACRDPAIFDAVKKLESDKRQTAFFDIDAASNNMPVERNEQFDEYLKLCDRQMITPDRDRNDGSINIMYSSSSPERVDFLKNAILIVERSYEDHDAGSIPKNRRNQTRQEEDKHNDQKCVQWRNSLPLTSIEFDTSSEHIQGGESAQSLSETQLEITSKKRKRVELSEKEQQEERAPLRRSARLTTHTGVGETTEIPSVSKPKHAARALRSAAKESYKGKGKAPAGRGKGDGRTS